MNEVRILVADDHEIVREGVRALVLQQPGWEICGEAANGREAMAAVERLQPDIVVMDLAMPELNGLDATREIKRIAPAVEVLIFTANETEQIIRQVFKAGARAYLLKSEAKNHLIPALQALRQHRTYFSSKVSEVIFAGYLSDDKAESAEGPRLSPRERETVQLVAEGKSNKEVAATLGISVKTAETHRAAVMRKLGLTGVAELVRYAIRNGIVEA